MRENFVKRSNNNHDNDGEKCAANDLKNVKTSVLLNVFFLLALNARGCA